MPRIHITAERRRLNDSQHRSNPMVKEYGCSHFEESRQASLLYVIVAAFPMPPEVVNMRGVKGPSKCHEHVLHIPVSFMFSWRRK